jgi:tRNA A37 threonylcarbamoyladenosine synthetase subunit TsaC/SUA5/YrdC
MSPWQRIGIFGFTGALLIGIALTTPSASGQGKGSVTKTTPDELLKDFGKNGKVANKKYAGATLEFSGIVKEAVREFNGKPVVLIKAGPKFAVIHCYTTDKQPWTKFTPGQEVKIVGKYPDSPVTLQLIECTVEPITKSTLITVTAEQITKEAQGGFKALGAKYTDKIVMISGKVVEKKFVEASGFTHVKLKGTAGYTVECRLPMVEKETAAAWKVDQLVTVVGKSVSTSGKEVNVDLCWTVSK